MSPGPRAVTRALRATAVFCALLSVSGCALLGAGGVPQTEWRALGADDPRPQRLLEGLDEDGARRRALRARARLALESPDLNFRRPQRIALARPEKLRVEVVGLFGQLAAIVASDGERVSVYDAAAGEIQHAPLDDEVLWRVARIALAPAEAAALLVGLPPAAPSTRFADAGIAEAQEAAGGRVRLRLAGNAAERWLEFDAAGRLVGVTRGGADAGPAKAGLQGARWSARFADFRDPRAGGSDASRPTARFPYAIDLVFPAHEAEVRVEYDAVELVESLPADLFVLQLAR